MGILGAAHGFEGGGGGGGAKRPPFPKICHTYPTMMKLGTVIPYLKEIQKYMNQVTHPFFHRKSANFVRNTEIVRNTLRNTDTDCILVHNF